MPNWLEDTIKIDGRHIHYHRTGGTGPPLVLLHGFGDNGLCWTRVAQELEADYDLIMPDARGHGLSYRIEAEIPLEPAVDVTHLIEALGLDKPALLGHSMGANTAALTAAQYPAQVGLVMLEDPAWFLETPRRTKLGKSGGPRSWVEDLWSKSYDEIVAEGRANSPTWADIEFGPWAESKLQLDHDILKVPSKASPWPEIVPKISCPILLIRADPELGGLVNPEIAQRLEKIWANGQVAHIEGAGHNIRREQFDKFIEVVARFLQEQYK